MGRSQTKTLPKWGEFLIGLGVYEETGFMVEGARNCQYAGCAWRLPMTLELYMERSYFSDKG